MCHMREPALRSFTCVICIVFPCPLINAPLLLRSYNDLAASCSPVVSTLYTNQRLAKTTLDCMTLPAELGESYLSGTVKRAGFMFSLQSLATQPANWRYVCMPSRMRMWVKPISRTNSSFVCSLRDGIVFVTLNILLMMSCEE